MALVRTMPSRLLSKASLWKYCFSFFQMYGDFSTAFHAGFCSADHPRLISRMVSSVFGLDVKTGRVAFFSGRTRISLVVLPFALAPQIP
jgi:hypothetical protein